MERKLSSQPINSIYFSADDYQCHITAYVSVRNGCQRNEKIEEDAKDEKTQKVPSIHVNGA